VAIAAGGSFSLMLNGDGTVVAWGSYPTIVWSGSSGYSTNIPMIVPSGLTNAAAIAAGGEHALVMGLVGAPVASPTPSHLTRTNNIFSLYLPMARGKSYRLEFKDSLSDAAWTALPPAPGDNTMKVLTDQSAAVPQRFYRVRLQ
ncbi:MAG: RCC1 domain-containing protein, partial [Verrucomicrobia bacterium]|nr:RCC1 domain-containing protein [Verrucomicrobiota bacterium]